MLEPPSSIPEFPNSHLPSTIQLEKSWWLVGDFIHFHTTLTSSALFEIMIPNSPIFLRSTPPTTGQPGSDWLDSPSSTIMSRVQLDFRFTGNDQQFAIESMAVEIVNFPMKNGHFP